MKPFLRLTPGAAEAGLITFRLALWVDGKERVHWPVNSGARGAQALRTYRDPQSRPGNLEPIPEAEYGLGPIEWAGTRDDWSTSWGSGLGPVWISIHDPGGGRGEFGIHLDANRSSSPGSAGCVVFPSRARMEPFLAAFREFPPTALVVDYGLGTVAGVLSVAESKLELVTKQTLEIVAHSGKLRARWGHQPWRDLDSFKAVADYK